MIKSKINKSGIMIFDEKMDAKNKIAMDKIPPRA